MHGFHDPLVEAAHARLITAFEALWEHRGTGLIDQDGVARLAACLLKDLHRHCRREEMLMRAQGYPDWSAHARAHRALRRAFRRRLVLDPRDPEGLARELARVRDLVIGHLVTWDDAYGAWLEARLSGAA